MDHVFKHRHLFAVNFLGVLNFLDKEEFFYETTFILRRYLAFKFKERKLQENFDYFVYYYGSL